VQGHTQHIADHLWMASSLQFGPESFRGSELLPQLSTFHAWVVVKMNFMYRTPFCKRSHIQKLFCFCLRRRNLQREGLCVLV